MIHRVDRGPVDVDVFDAADGITDAAEEQAEAHAPEADAIENRAAAHGQGHEDRGHADRDHVRRDGQIREQGPEGGDHRRII
jgi:hypothetical protein